MVLSISPSQLRPELAVQLFPLHVDNLDARALAESCDLYKQVYVRRLTFHLVAFVCTSGNHSCTQILGNGALEVAIVVLMHR